MAARRIRLLLADFQCGFHGRLAFAVALFTGTVQAAEPGTNRVNNAVFAGPLSARPVTFYGFRRPVGSHVGLCAVPVS